MRCGAGSRLNNKRKHHTSMYGDSSTGQDVCSLLAALDNRQGPNPQWLILENAPDFGADADTESDDDEAADSKLSLGAECKLQLRNRGFAGADRKMRSTQHGSRSKRTRFYRFDANSKRLPLPEGRRNVGLM